MKNTVWKLVTLRYKKQRRSKIRAGSRYPRKIESTQYTVISMPINKQLFRVVE
jgi:hypothetical protein